MFTECFKHKKFCRFCTVDKTDINSTWTEKECQLRTVSSCEKDLLKNGPEEIRIVDLIEDFNYGSVKNKAAEILESHI